MKNVLLFFAAGALLLTGCIKNETTLVDTPSDQKIVFEAPVVSVATRGSATEAEVGTQTNPYSTTEWFTVHAIKHTNEYTAGTFAANSSPAFMDLVDVQYNSEYQGWVAVNGTYVWPKVDYLTFMAYSPAAASKDATSFSYSTNGLSINNFTVPAVGKHYDLMFTDFVKNQHSKDMSNGTYYNGVQLTFKHALSSILFNVGLAEDYTDLGITINNITLNNFKKAGSFAQTIADGDVTGTPVWTVQDTPVADYKVNTVAVPLTYNSGTTTPLELSGTNQNGNYIILMPQVLSDDHTLSVNYTVTPTTGTAITETVTIVLNDYYYKLGGTGSDIALTKFEMGYQYTFNIKVGVDRIYFAPNVTPWTDAVIDVTID